MNEELKQRLIKYLDGMEGAIDKAVDFTVEQAPLVIQDILNWAITESIISLVFMVSLILVACYAANRILKNIKNDKSIGNADREFNNFMTYLVSGMIVIPLTLGSFFTAQNGLKAYVAPRLYILEQIKDFVNDSK